MIMMVKEVITPFLYHVEILFQLIKNQIFIFVYLTYMFYLSYTDYKFIVFYI